MNIGEKIKLARKKARLTQKELGEKLGITYQQIGQYENGKRQPKIETIRRIADALNVNYTDLLPEFTIEYQKLIKELIDIPELKIGNIYNISPDSIEKMHSTLSAINLPLDEKKKQLIENYDKLNHIGQGKLIDYAEDLTTISKYQKEEA